VHRMEKWPFKTIQSRGRGRTGSASAGLEVRGSRCGARAPGSRCGARGAGPGVQEWRYGARRMSRLNSVPIHPVLLADPTSDLVLALATAVAAAPVDPPGLSDHRWLSGEPTGVRDRIQESIDSTKHRGGSSWIVLAGGAPVGLIKVGIGHGMAETFTFVCAYAQGRGVATAARTGVLDLLAHDGRVQRAVSTARANSASAAISRRLGYRYTGIEVRQHPDDASDVALERYELELESWQAPEEVTPARLAAPAASTENPDRS
jgi:RimJ/RimL family protein N-acetyltransferase